MTARSIPVTFVLSANVAIPPCTVRFFIIILISEVKICGFNRYCNKYLGFISERHKSIITLLPLGLAVIQMHREEFM